jgi:cytochrome P450
MVNTESVHAKREDPSKPAWSGDRLDLGAGPEIEAPYFDQVLDSWVLSRHDDVLAAFRCSGLAPAGPHTTTYSASPDQGDRLAMREETLEALCPALLNEWRDRLTPEADALAASLSIDAPVDLVGEYARPLCLALSSLVTGIELNDARRLQEKARQISAAAADPWDPVLRDTGKSASAELRACFHSGPETLRDAGFVALSQTIPAILGNAWFALLQHPEEWRRLHGQPALIDQAIEELFRYAGPIRAIFRIATEDVSVNRAPIRRGERVVLRIIAANRDPERFPQANQLEITRRASGHLMLGAGPHSCVAASLIRMAAVTITRPLLKRTSSATLAESPDWQGGPIFRQPSSLLVRLS